MLQPLEDELSALEAQRQEVISWQGEAAQAADEIKGLRALAEMAREGLDDIEPERQAELFDLLQIKGRLLAPPPPMRKGPPCGLAAWFRERDRLVPELTDEGWELVAPLIAGRTTDARKVLEALLRKVLTGARWRELETEYGTTALRSCWKRWSASGLWEEVMAALPQEGQPVPRQHPLPLIALTGKLQPGLIFLASEDHDREPAPWGQFFNVAYQFSMATAV
jgi:transposase